MVCTLARYCIGSCIHRTEPYTIALELHAGLDFSKLEAQRYLQAAVKAPIKYKDFPVGQVEQALGQLVSGQEEQADEQALTVLNVSKGGRIRVSVTRQC